MKGAHQFSVGIKGQLAKTGTLTAVLFLVNAKTLAKHYESDLGRVADGFSALLVVGRVAG